ncbi:MAG: hypothetical protein QXP86_03400 [Nitrososphaerota archaeon]
MPKWYMVRSLHLQIKYLARNEKGQRDEIVAYAGVEPEAMSRKTRGPKKPQPFKER